DQRVLLQELQIFLQLLMLSGVSIPAATRGLIYAARKRVLPTILTRLRRASMMRMRITPWVPSDPELTAPELM
ncbi:MAG: hypothetical protein M3294_01290, partial [Pseudomonadota bacterium]|nr:hypothetical protein [Pseudomonadota bacterium]